MRIGIALLCLVLAASAPGSAHADAAIGYVKTLSGTATLISAGAGEDGRPISIGTPLHEHDRVETGRDGQIGITFCDDTRITMGPNSRAKKGRRKFSMAE